MKKILIFVMLMGISTLAISAPNYTYTVYNYLKNNTAILSASENHIFSAKHGDAYSINYKASGKINLKCPNNNDFNFFSYKPSKDKSGEFVFSVKCSGVGSNQKLKVIPIITGNDIAMTVDNSTQSIYLCSSKTYSLNGSSCVPQE